MIATWHQQIIDKTHQIIQIIENSSEMKLYRQAESKLQQHQHAQQTLLLATSRRNAYSQLSLRHGYEHPSSRRAKQLLDETLAEIQNIPLIEQYQQSQEEVNEILQSVIRTLILSLSEKIPVEITEESVSSGCGTSGTGCGGCSSNGHCGH